MLRSGEDCECKWSRLEPDSAWSATQPRFVTVKPLSSVDQCELACCYRQLGCAAYTYVLGSQIFSLGHRYFLCWNFIPFGLLAEAFVQRSRYTPDGVCKLWVDLDGTPNDPSRNQFLQSPVLRLDLYPGTQVIKTEGARSGTNSGHHQCTAPQGVDPTHPDVPFDYDVAVGWYVAAAIICVASVYIIVGTLIIPEQGQVRLSFVF